MEATHEGMNAQDLPRESLVTENYKMITDTLKKEGM